MLGSELDFLYVMQMHRSDVHNVLVLFSDDVYGLLRVLVYSSVVRGFGVSVQTMHSTPMHANLPTHEAVLYHVSAWTAPHSWSA